MCCLEVSFYLLLIIILLFGIHSSHYLIFVLLNLQLALKHRLNKRQEARIVVFVGSPITASEQELVRLGTCPHYISQQSTNSLQFTKHKIFNLVCFSFVEI